MNLEALVRAVRGVIPMRHPGARPLPTGLCEPLEHRRLLATILWTNQGVDNFGIYGANATTARNIVNRAIDDWERVIVDFNYDDTGGNLNNTFSLEIDAAAIGGRGVTNNITRDDATDRKPTSADITMDDNGGGDGWYFDPAIGSATVPDDGEYTNIINLFAADSPTGSGNDFYRTIVHEIGHAMGILDSRSATPFLRIGDFQSSAGADPNGGTLINVDLPGGVAQDYTMTSDGGGHMWEGDGPGGILRPEHPDDFLNSGRTVATGLNRRQLISDTVVELLRDAYNYVIVLPSQINTFFANLNTTTNVVTLNGELGANVNIRRDGTSGMFELGNGGTARERIPEAQWTTLTYIGTSGNDDVDVDQLVGGKTVTLNMGLGNDRVDISELDEDIDSNVLSNITINAGSGDDRVVFHDTLDSPSADNWTLTGTSTAKSTRVFTLSSVEFQDLLGSVNPETFYVNGTQGEVTIDGAGGNDIFNIGGGDIDTNLGGAMSITGGAGIDVLNFDDTLDGPTGDTWVMTSTVITKGSVDPVTYATIETINVDGSEQGENISIDSMLADLVFNANGGDDRFTVGNGDLDNVRSVTLAGGAGDDTVELDDTADTGADPYELTSSLVTKPGAGAFVGLALETVASRVEHLLLRANNLANAIHVVSAFGLEIYAGGGADVIDHDGNNTATPTLIDGGTGLDDLILNDDGTGLVTAVIASSQDLGILSILSGARLTILPGSDKTVTATGTNLDGVFDLNDNTYIRLGSPVTEFFRTRLQTGYNNGLWNGSASAIVSGVSASSSAVDGIGFGTAAQLGILSYNGIPVSGTDLILDHTLLGDANLSKTVDLTDFGILRSNFGQSPRIFSQGDFNYTGTVDLADFGILRGNFGLSLGSGGNLFRGDGGGGDGGDDSDLPDRLK